MGVGLAGGVRKREKQSEYQVDEISTLAVLSEKTNRSMITVVEAFMIDKLSAMGSSDWGLDSFNKARESIIEILFLEEENTAEKVMQALLDITCVKAQVSPVECEATIAKAKERVKMTCRLVGVFDSISKESIEVHKFVNKNLDKFLNCDFKAVGEYSGNTHLFARTKDFTDVVDMCSKHNNKEDVRMFVTNFLTDLLEPVQLETRRRTVATALVNVYEDDLSSLLNCDDIIFERNAKALKRRMTYVYEGYVEVPKSDSVLKMLIEMPFPIGTMSSSKAHDKRVEAVYDQFMK